jgi:hypothetical protein
MRSLRRRARKLDRICKVLATVLAKAEMEEAGARAMMLCQLLRSDQDEDSGNFSEEDARKGDGVLWLRDLRE